MTKEELERIKQAYNSGLKIQIWFDGNWEDFDIREYSMYPEPFSEHRRYRIVGSAYADFAEQRIAELEKENVKAKKIIEHLLLLPYANNEEVFSDVTSVLVNAERFLKGLDK